MAGIYRDRELWLYGYVGESSWEEGFTASEVLEALAEHGRNENITVHINSGGGSAYDGLAIYNALTAHKGDVRIEVDAVAASAAFTIMMAGDKIVMRAGSICMAHDPSAVLFGTADDHDKAREALDKLGGQMAAIYAERSGRDPAEVRQAMKDELWLTSDEAVEQGYADEAEKAKAVAVSAFDYRTYAHAPQRLVALAKAKNWRLPDAEQTAKSAGNPGQEEISMTDKERADALAAELAALKATATADAAALADLKAKAADRERQDAIMALPEAEGREATAKALAAAAGMTAEVAKGILASAPKASAAVENEDDEQPDPKAYEARRAAGAGLNSTGKSNAPGAATAQAKGVERAVANMKKLLGTKESA